ncbi:hypothetical protein GCM10008932_05670 [Alkalibacterium iburiense]|uniref:Holin n=1 Tax=Alkalibacterium iburiense TaxID=290589 RepID=A0ABP3GY71_9LACT
MKINNHFYDVSKWIVLIFLPALAVLISGLGELYGWEGTFSMVTTVNLVNVFLGSLLQISSIKYYGNEKSEGGIIIGTKYSKPR